MIEAWLRRLIGYLLRRAMMFFEDENGNAIHVSGSNSFGIVGCTTGAQLVSDYQRVSSGNKAFDEYREETLKRLEEDRKLFEEFMERLRLSKDKAEFDQFMAERNASEKAKGEK